MEANKIIITGGATRIGAAIAEKLSGPNVEIVIHYNKSKGAADKLKKKLTLMGSKIYLIKGDLSKEIDLNKIIKFSKNKIYPKGRSTMGLPGTRAQKGKKKWKQIR